MAIFSVEMRLLLSNTWDKLCLGTWAAQNWQRMSDYEETAFFFFFSSFSGPPAESLRT